MTYLRGIPESFVWKLDPLRSRLRRGRRVRRGVEGKEDAVLKTVGGEWRNKSTLLRGVIEFVNASGSVFGRGCFWRYNGCHSQPSESARELSALTGENKSATNLVEFLPIVFPTGLLFSKCLLIGHFECNKLDKILFSVTVSMFISILNLFRLWNVF